MKLLAITKIHRKLRVSYYVTPQKNKRADFKLLQILQLLFLNLIFLCSKVFQLVHTRNSKLSENSNLHLFKISSKNISNVSS